MPVVLHVDVAKDSGWKSELGQTFHRFFPCVFHSFASFAMSGVKYSEVKTSEEVGYIDTVRRVSGIQLSNKKTPEAAEEQVYIEAIRRVSGVNVGMTAADAINLKRERSTAKIQAERGLSSAEIGVIEGVRRLSGINAALLELGEPVKRNPSQVHISADGKIVAAAPEKEKDGLGDVEWHLFSQADLFKELDSRIEGLSTAEVETRLEKYGLNEITPPPVTHWLVKFFLILIGGFQLMMWFGSALCFIVYGLSGGEDVQTLALAIVLIVVVLLTATFQFYQVQHFSFSCLCTSFFFIFTFPCNTSFVTGGQV